MARPFLCSESEDPPVSPSPLMSRNGSRADEGGGCCRQGKASRHDYAAERMCESVRMIHR